MKKLLILLFTILLLSCSNEGSVNELPFNQRNNLPIVTLQINGKYVKLLVDTGATMCILDSSLKDELGYSTVPSGVVFQGIGGDKTARKIVNTTTTYKNAPMDINFVELDLSNVKHSIGVSGIIGSNFLENNNYSVDFKNNKLIKIVE